MSERLTKARDLLVLTARRWWHRQRDEFNVVVSEGALGAAVTTFEAALSAEGPEEKT